MDRLPDYASGYPAGIRPATAADAHAVGNALRREHIEEIRSQGHPLPPERALALSFAQSVENYAVVAGGRAILVMGVMPAGILTRTAEVWMLGTEAMRRYPGRVLRAGLWGVERAFSATGAARLEQWIPEWYETGLRYVERLGFVRHPAAGGLVRVTRERDC